MILGLWAFPKSNQQIAGLTAVEGFKLHTAGREMQDHENFGEAGILYSTEIKQFPEYISNFRYWYVTELNVSD